MTLNESTEFSRRMGYRFEIFRRLVLKTRADFAQESNLMEQYFESFEKGYLIPETILLAHFFKNYGLNVTWLVFGEEEIFYKKSEKVPVFSYTMSRDMDPDSKKFKNALDFIDKVKALEHKFDDFRSIETIEELRARYKDLVYSI